MAAPHPFLLEDDAHWSLDQILWNEDEMFALDVPPDALGAAGAPLQPARAPARGGKPAARRRVRSDAFQCQVPGCAQHTRPGDPPPSRYSVRYRLCGTHLYAESLSLRPDGPLLRHCQKCSVLHPLHAFDGVKRSCAAQLERQRQRRAARGGDGSGGATDPASPAAGASPSASVSASATRRRDTSAETVSAAAPPEPPEEGVFAAEGAALAELAHWQGPAQSTAAFLISAAGTSASDPFALPRLAPPTLPLLAPPLAPTSAFGGSFAAGSGCDDLTALMMTWQREDAAAPDATIAAPWLDVRIKMPDVLPTAMPPHLHAALAAVLGPAAVGLHAAVRPGCTLLTACGVLLRRRSSVDELAPASAALLGAAEVAAALRGGPARAFFRDGAGASFDVAMRRRDDAAADVAPRLAGLPTALHSGAAAQLRVTLPPGTAERHRLRCRLHGRYVGVSLARAPGRDASCHIISVPATAAAGLALWELEPLAQHADVAPALVPMLLTPDAKAAAELAAALPRGEGADAEAATAALLACLGHTLRGGAAADSDADAPAAPAALARAAARACLARGWLAAAALVLRACTADACAAEAAAPGAPSLLHAALCSPAPAAALALVLESLSPAAAAADAAAAWGDDDADADAHAATSSAPLTTPMHLAAAAADAATALALARALLAHFPARAAAAWALAADARGRTPADVARVLHGSGTAAAAKQLLALDAATRADVAAAARRAALAAADAHDALSDAPAWRRFQRAPARRAAALHAAADELALSGDLLAAAVAARASRAAATSASADGALLPRQQRRGLFPLPRLPGAFADPAMEAAWLRHVTRLFWFSDAAGYPFAALSHAAQLFSLWLRRGALPTTPQVGHVVAMMLLVPALMCFAPAFFARRREAVHAFMRLLGSVMLPVWLQQRPGLDAPVVPVSHVQSLLTLFGMAFFSLAAVVRAPLHAALQVASFAITVGVHGITAHLPMRLAVVALNLAVVIYMERASRRRFAAAWRAGDKAAKRA